MAALTLKMGTRGSALALAQSGQAAEALRRLHRGLSVETVVIKTSGDLFGHAPLREARTPVQGVKGLFVKEIEEALAAGKIDFAVHSAKDLPAGLAPGLVIAAYPEREDPRDCFIGKDGLSFKDLKAGMRVATSSLRRRVQLSQAVPGLEFLPMRGNVDTRLRKLKEGVCDALVLAMAGVNRLGVGENRQPLPAQVMVPSPAQGALALEVRADRPEIKDVIAALDHAPTRLEVELERLFLKAVGGGCETPVGALARAKGDGARFWVFWAEPDGSRAKRLEAELDDPAEAEVFVRELAARIKK